MTYPIKLNWRTEVIPLIIIFLAFAVGTYFYNTFPETVVTHWNFEGEPDGYSGKLFGALGLPAILLGMYILFLVLPLIDPRRDRYSSFSSVYHKLKTAIMLVFFGIFLVTGVYNLGYDLPIGHIVPMTIGALFLLVGNVMGKMKRNWFMGIRTPWTLASENVWNKTHRVGGWLFVLFGFIMMVMPFLNKTLGLGIFVIGIVALVFGTAVYSYIAFQQEKK